MDVTRDGTPEGKGADNNLRRLVALVEAYGDACFAAGAVDCDCDEEFVAQAVCAIAAPKAALLEALGSAGNNRPTYTVLWRREFLRRGDGLVAFEPFLQPEEDPMERKGLTERDVVSLLAAETKDGVAVMVEVVEREPTGDEDSGGAA